MCVFLFSFILWIVKVKTFGLVACEVSVTRGEHTFTFKRRCSGCRRTVVFFNSVVCLLPVSKQILKEREPNFNEPSHLRVRDVDTRRQQSDSWSSLVSCLQSAALTMMERAAEELPPAAADASASTFSQVVFTDIPHSYPPSTTVTCRYTYSTAFQPNSRDWVGIFKVGKTGFVFAF